MPDQLTEKTNLWLETLRRGGKEADKEAMGFFCDQVVPLLMPMLRERFHKEYPEQRRGGRYDGLISLLGYTPETVILTYRFTQPDKLVILHTPETAHFIEQVRHYTGAPEGAIHSEQFDKANTEQIYSALDAALQKLGRTSRVAIELTGGTKPMGAALQLAAAVYDIDTLYIDYTKYLSDVRKPWPESTYIRLMENPLKTHFNLLRPAHLGLMAAAAAHELNQPVGIIRSATQAALLDVKAGLFKPDDLVPLLERTFRQSERLATVIDNFRRLARGNRVAHDELVDINELSERTTKIFAEQFRVKNIAVHMSLSRETPVVKANSVLLEEVLLNLLSNARDALEGRADSEIWIATWSQRDGKCGFSVTDNGPGLPEAYRNLLFIPFVSTKATNKGMGMGLFISRRILDDLGGSIGYRDRIGGGASFQIELPACEVG